MDIKFENLEKIDLLIEKIDKLESKILGAKRLEISLHSNTVSQTFERLQIWNIL